MSQAPEPEVLKRKRSRPSDWWANGSIIASTPQRLPVAPEPTEQEPAKKRGRYSNSGVAEPLVRDAPNVGNRGRPAKKRQTNGDAENGPDELEGGKPVRRGRSSGTGEELRNPLASSRNDAPAVKGKRGPKSALEHTEEAAITGKNSETKRRRRPTVVQLDVEEVEEIADTEQPAGSRRGRPFVKESAVSSAQQEVLDAAGVKRRGHRSKADKVAPLIIREENQKAQEVLNRRGPRNVEAAAGEIQAPIVTATRRRRPEVQRSSSSMNDEPGRGRTRTRQSNVELQEAVVTAAQVSSQAESGRRQTRLSDAQTQEGLPSESMMKQKGRGRKTSRQRQATNVNVETASSRLTKAQSGPGRVSRTAPNKGSTAREPGQTKQRTQPPSSSAGRRTSQATKKNSKQKPATEPPRKRKAVENEEVTPAKRRRLSKAARDEQADVPEVEEPSMLYQHLKPVARKVSRQTIAAKWEPLPPACADRIKNLLQDVQRPVVAHINDERKKMQASTALQMVSRRLVHKISKGLPFPPATRNQREDDFDFEKILDHNRALESQLTPALHGNELLEAELAKEMEWLEADQETLAELEKNARSETTARNKAARKLHALLQTNESQVDNSALKDDTGMNDNQRPVMPLDLDMHDDDLQGLTKGLYGHVDTIHGNMKQVSGISEAIVRSKAAIQGTLFDHLSDVQYEEVILGLD